jgi:hypothetical protein
MREVTKQVFFKIMGPRDVHPHPFNREGVRGSDWKMVKSGRLVGRTLTGRSGQTTSYQINEDLVDATSYQTNDPPPPETTDDNRTSNSPNPQRQGL